MKKPLIRALLVGSVSLSMTLTLWARHVSASLSDLVAFDITSLDAIAKGESKEDSLLLLLADDSSFSEKTQAPDMEPVTFFDHIKNKLVGADGINPRNSFRILQFGDSHTAGDFFVDQLRTTLKQQFGDAGIGWINPVSVRGQRTALYSVRRSGSWLNQYQKSRADTLRLPIGGYSTVGASGSRLAVMPSKPLPHGIKVQFSALVRSVKGDKAQVSFRVGQQPYTHHSVGKSWQLITDSFIASNQHTYDLLVENGNVEVAALFLDSDQQGVIVESIGRNSAELSWLKNWSGSSMNILFRHRPVDLIVLEYGTNEAVDVIKSSRYYSELQAQIDRFQKALPGVPIVIVSVPSFAKYPNSSCRQPRSLMQIHGAQKLFAEKTPGVSTWSWLESMGGACAVRSWSAKGLMASDWIHFSSAGYKQSANLFMQWLAKQPMQ